MEEGGPEQDETMGCTLGTSKNAFLILFSGPLSSSEAPLSDFVGPSNPAELRRQEREAPEPTE